MASIIRVKRSTGVAAPSTLNFGEVGLTIGVGTHGNSGGRLFAGDNASNPQVIGGRYFTDLLSIAPGLVAGQSNPTTAANGFVPIVDANEKVDRWNVDNLRLDGNTFSSTNTDGDINIDPNGTGEIVIPDDTFLTFGTSKDSKIEYDEDGADKIQVTGADWNYNNGVQITVSDVTQSNSKDTGALVVEGGVGIEKNLNVGGAFDVTGISSFSSQVNITGGLAITGGIEVDNIGISSNIIATRQGGGNTLYIDPYPDGLSNEGLVVVKGDLQVDGTTTTVNSTAVTVNDAIMRVGDTTSTRTVMVTVGSGTSTVVLDSIVGINTGDVVAGTNIGAGTSVHSYVTPAGGVGLGTIFLDANTSGSIGTTTQLTITHAYDTNTDRGIAFDYNTSLGVTNKKTGFFGFDDNSIATSTAGALNHGTHANDTRRWTYVPDATISNEVVSGTKGFLDVKGIYYQSGDFSTNGIVYFDNQGLQRSTIDPTNANGTRTSTQVLTAVTEIVLTLSATHTFAAGDQITQQSNSAAYGVVKTSTSSSNSVTLIGVQGTFDTTNDLVKNGTSISINPTVNTTTYTNKPTWTDTLDGGTF